MKGKRIVLTVLVAGLCWIGAGPARAEKKVVIAPPAIDVAAVSDEAREVWSFQLRDVVDQRGKYADTPVLGTADQRFSDEDLTIVLSRPPAEYLRAEIDRFLLLRAVQASTKERARIYLDVVINQLHLTKDAKEITDRMVVTLDYTVNFTGFDGVPVGNVRIPKIKWIKSLNPFGSEKIIGELIRDSLQESLLALEGSNTWADAMKR